MYAVKMGEYIDRITNNQYILEVTKCCGYGFFIAVYKNSTLDDLYRSVLHEIPSAQIELYVYAGVNEKLVLPRDGTVLKTFIADNGKSFVPVYPIPAKVVYKIYVDDGHCHDHVCG